MEDLKFITFDEALAGMLRSYWGRTGVMPDLTPGQPLLSTFEAVSFIIDEASYNFNKDLLQGIVTGTAKALGLSLQAEASSSIPVQLSRATPAPADILIPAGTRIQTASGIQFSVKSTNPLIPDITLLAGQTSISTVIGTAITPGESGNVPTGTVTQFVDTIPGVENVTNTSAGTGGTNAETTDQLQARVTLEIAKLAIGTLPSLEAIAVTVTTGSGERATRAKAVDKRLDPSIPFGITRIYVYRPGGVSGTLNALILSTIEGAYRAAGVTLEIINVTINALSVTANIVGANANIIATADTAIREFFDALNIGEDLDPARLSAYVASKTSDIYAVHLTSPAAITTINQYERAELTSSPTLTYTYGTGA